MYLCTFLINNYIINNYFLRLHHQLKIDDAPTQKHDGEQKNIKEVDIKTPAQVSKPCTGVLFIKSLI